MYKIICNYLWVTLSRVLGTEVILYGIEVTDIRNNKSKLVWKKFLKKVDWVITRTQKSKEILLRISDNKDIFSFPDITFALSDSDLKKYINNDEENKEYKDFILWALAMPWSLKELQNEHYKNRYRRLISTLVDINHYIKKIFPDYQNILVPFLYPGDMNFALDLISEGFDNAEIYSGNLTEIRPLFSKAKFAIDMRFHSVIFSVFEECPFIAISYSPKTTDTLHDNGLDCYTEFGIRESSYFYKEFDLDREEMYQLIDKMISSSQQKVDSQCLRLKSLNGEKRLIDWLNN